MITVGWVTMLHKSGENCELSKLLTRCETSVGSNAGNGPNSDEKAMQAQPCSAVEFRPFRDEDRIWVGGSCAAITR